jgi:arylsulfatase A-like enzyme
LRLWSKAILRLLVGTYFVLTSLYCLLAFLPYTYYFLIKAPAYAWMPWFVHDQAALYWLAAIAALIANWDLRNAWQSRDKQFVISMSGFALAGVWITFRPFLTNLENTRSAYWWSLAALLPLVVASLSKLSERSAHPSRHIDHTDGKLFAYSGALLIACVISAVYLAGARMRLYSQTRSLSFHGADAEFVVWSLVSHIILALAVFSVINLAVLVSAKTPKPRLVQLAINGALIFAALWTVLFDFLDSALSFSGWTAHVYAAALALSSTLWGFSLVLPFLEHRQSAEPSRQVSSLPFGTWAVLLMSCGLAIAFPYMIGEADWSGFLQSTVTFLLWITVSVCLFRLGPARARYSAVVVLAVLAASATLYKGLQASEIFWSRPLGSTDDEISLTLEAYAGQDNSFQLAHHILGNSRHEVCGDLCRILRENTNIGDARVRGDVQLVEHLIPARGEWPNIFVFVIDSMRPDYLGAYNPKVDYTPNLDAFARDSVVLHNAYSQYAGTSLSEPAIWSGAVMLHAHYPQPFSRLNNLDRMVHADGYEKIISEDEVLSAILPADDDVVKLDTDKKLWNQLELGSTLRQAEAVLDSRKNPDQPVFVYAQPKNVHQFARNDVPSPASQHWPDRPGLNTRITYEVHWVDSCLGQFFSYLKRRGMYDNSIIIVTSDHGDATGEFGRMSHSTLIWPEVMRVPLLIHLPPSLRGLVSDDTRPATLTDLTPTLYYLLGHRPVRQNALYGRPLLAQTRQELNAYPRRDLLLASDVRAVYGILTADGRYLYTTYDSPAQSYLFDLAADPNAQHDILTPALKQRYDEEIIEHLQSIGDYYGYKPGVGRLLASAGRRD